MSVPRCSRLAHGARGGTKPVTVGSTAPMRPPNHAAMAPSSSDNAPMRAPRDTALVAVAAASVASRCAASGLDDTAARTVAPACAPPRRGCSAPWPSRRRLGFEQCRPAVDRPWQPRASRRPRRRAMPPGRCRPSHRASSAPPRRTARHSPALEPPSGPRSGSRYRPCWSGRGRHRPAGRRPSRSAARRSPRW